jgi:hypothetical protein
MKTDFFFVFVFCLFVFFNSVKLLSHINGNSVNYGCLFKFIISVRGGPCDCSS